MEVRLDNVKEILLREGIPHKVVWECKEENCFHVACGDGFPRVWEVQVSESQLKKLGLVVNPIEEWGGLLELTRKR